MEENKKEARIKLEEEIDFMKKDLDESIKGKGWGSQGKAQNFIKKGTGIGGGQTGKFVSTSNDKSKSYETQIR